MMGSSQAGQARCWRANPRWSSSDLEGAEADVEPTGTCDPDARAGEDSSDQADDLASTRADITCSRISPFPCPTQRHSSLGSRLSASPVAILRPRPPSPLLRSSWTFARALCSWSSIDVDNETRPLALSKVGKLSSAPSQGVGKEPVDVDSTTEP